MQLKKLVLCARARDPDPSWLAYDRVAFGLPLPQGAVLEQQKRAYTSPIWYTPSE
jgi:hypothetical protein